MNPGMQPFQAQHETSKTPNSKGGECQKIGHHCPQGEKQHVLGHEIECQARNQDWRRTAENIKSCTCPQNGFIGIVEAKCIKSKDDVDSEDDTKGGVQK